MEDPPKEATECARCGETSCHCDVFPYSLYPALYSPLPTPGFLSSVENSIRMKAGVESWRALYQSVGYCSSTQQLPYHPYSDQNLESASTRRKNATRESTSTLKAWLHEHLKNPYPTKGEKIMLAIITKMTLTQVSTWFANARRRLKKENKMTWSTHHRGADDSDGDDDVWKDDDVKLGELDVGNDYVTPKQGQEDVDVVDEKLVEAPEESPSSSRVKAAVPDSNQKDNEVAPKPKIWSLVDTATSVSPKPRPPTIAPGYIPIFPPYFSYLLPNYHSFISPYYKAQSSDLDA